MQVTAEEKSAQVPAARAGRRCIASHAGAVAAALFSLAVIAQASLDQPNQEPAAQTAITLDPAAVVGMLNAAFTADGVRNKPHYPMEFETILGPTTVASLDLFAQASWPAQGPIAVASAQPATPARRLAQACPASGCKPHAEGAMKVAEASVLPPARPALLLPAAAVPPVAAAQAQPVPVRVGLAEERRLQFLGVKLPGFVPNGHAIVSTMLSWGGTVADLVPRI